MGMKPKERAVAQRMDFNELQLKVRRAVECLHRDRPNLEEKDLSKELQRIAVNFTPNNRNDMLAILISAPYILDIKVSLMPVLERGTHFQAQEMCRWAISASLEQEARDWHFKIR